MSTLSPFEPLVTFSTPRGEAAVATFVYAAPGLLTIEVYDAYSELSVGEILRDVTVRSGEGLVYSGKATVCASKRMGSACVVSLTLAGKFAIAPIIRWSAESVCTGDPINRGYQVMVSEFRAFLSQTSCWASGVAQSASLPVNSDGHLRDDVFNYLAAPFFKQAAQYLAWLEQEAQAIAPEAISAHRRYVQRALHPLLLPAPFVYRAFAKPLGYAGDYAMVNQILGKPRQGDTTYAQMLNTLFLGAAVAQAHRNRVDILTDRLHALAARAHAEGRQMRVLSIGCGPAAEVQRFIARDARADALSFVLMDFNAPTLHHTQAQIEQICGEACSPVKVRYVNESVQGLLLRRPASDAELMAGGAFDFVYCAGLFDYLSDKICERLLLRFASLLNEDGQVLVSNVHTCNPQKALMEHLLEWHLTYRDEAQLQSLLPPAAEQISIYVDSTGVNVFAELRLKTSVLH